MPAGTYAFERIGSFAWAGGAAAKAGTLVAMLVDETCNLPGASTVKPLGVLAQDVEIGGTATVILCGSGAIVIVSAGGTIALNDMMTSNASGLAIATTTATHWVYGICRKAAANGQYAMMQLVGDHVITA